MSKYIWLLFFMLLGSSLSFAEPQKKQKNCAKITVHIKKFWVFEDTLNATNCEGTAEISRVVGNKDKGFFITSFDLAKFKIPSEKGKRSFFKTFKGGFQQVIFYSTDHFDLRKWKDRTKNKEVILSEGKFTINGKNIPVAGHLYLLDGYSELVVNTTFDKLGLEKPDIDGFFRKQKDQVTFTISSPHQNLEK